MTTPTVSIVIPVHNEAHRLQETVTGIRATADVPYEIIVVDDVSTDGGADFIAQESFDDVRLIRSSVPLGVAGARNRGALEARAPMVLFMDGHCYPGKGFLSVLTQALLRLGRGIVVPEITVHGNPQASGFGMTLAGPGLMPVWLSRMLTDPYQVPVGCGCVQMFFKTWFEQIGGYDKMRTYGVEDLEISIRSWLLGGPVHVVPMASVAHFFRSSTTCKVGWPDVIYNSLRMAHLHFSGDRLEKLEAHWSGHSDYKEARELLGNSDINERRAWLDARRVHSADWYCEKFGISI